MTKKWFTRLVADQTKGIIRMAAIHAIHSGQEGTFVQELLEQDSDEGSRSGLKRVLGEELYNELQSLNKR